jgi:hypothetical protein
MAFTDTSITAYIFPQDSGFDGIANSDADWGNAAYIGGLAQAKGVDYAPFGLNITEDHTNEVFDISRGLAFIEDNTTIGARNFSDSEQNRSITWDQPFMTFMLVPAQTNIPFQTTTGTNHIWIYYTHGAQNDGQIRVSDTDGDTPSDPHLKIGTIDAANNNAATEKNRVAGYSWNFLGKYETDGFVGEADVQWPENGYDEYKVKFINVQGQGTSGGQQLQARINNVTSGYYYRTTQNNTANADRFRLMQGEGGEMHIAGHLYFSMDAGKWQYDNRLTSNEEKQYSFAGSNYNTTTNPLNSMQVFWGSGQNINGEWNIWGRDRL